MSTPRFVPSALLKSGFRFGRARHDAFGWRTPSEPDDAAARIRLRAAQMQNDLVFASNPALEALGGGRGPNVKVAQLAGFSAQRFARVRRGEVLMRLEDLAAIELATGAVFEFRLTQPQRASDQEPRGWSQAVPPAPRAASGRTSSSAWSRHPRD